MDCKLEVSRRTKWISDIVTQANAQGVVYGNSGGKDCALVSILCKLANVATLGVILPCESKRNYTIDTADALTVAKQFDIETITIDLTPTKQALASALSAIDTSLPLTLGNINPRLRMTTLYAVGASRNYLVAGTGNRSEISMGYFTKWGDGACDFNPISDLTVREIYQLLEYLNAPSCIISKAPSAALFDSQTDEDEMGISYNEIDDFLLNGIGSASTRVETATKMTAHKRRMPIYYPNMQ